MEKQKGPKVEHNKLSDGSSVNNPDVHYRAGLHLVYKKLGETPLEVIKRFKLDNPEYDNDSITYAGRLDPMAEGLLLLLSGEKVHEKEKYLGLQKTYEFEVLWGFETDTLDILGLNDIKDFSTSFQVVPSIESIKNYLKSRIGQFEQKYPAYSSKPVEGKPLFMWAREGKLDTIVIPTHSVEAYDTCFISRRVIHGKDLLSQIESKISLVSGDFRQDEALKLWKNALSNRLDESFVVDKLTVTASTGFYVRQYVADLAKNLNTRAVTYSIYRGKIGEYDVASL